MTTRMKVSRDPAILKREITALELEIGAQEGRKAELLQKLKSKDYKMTNKAHIRLLHEYNEIRDIGHMLIEKIAIDEHVLQKEVMARFGVTLAD